MGSLVADLQKAIDQKLNLPDGYYIEYGGQFENMTRALGHLSIIIPLTIVGIFFLLFLLFNSVRFATLIITVLPFASIGGIFGWPLPENICLSRPLLDLLRSRVLLY